MGVIRATKGGSDDGVVNGLPGELEVACVS